MKGDDEYLDIGDTLDNIGLENLVLNDARELSQCKPRASSGSRAIEMAGVSNRCMDIFCTRRARKNWCRSVFKSWIGSRASTLLKARNQSSSSPQLQHAAVLRGEFVTKFDDDNDSI